MIEFKKAQAEAIMDTERNKEDEKIQRKTIHEL
jgi:hypothetical protein